MNFLGAESPAGEDLGEVDFLILMAASGLIQISGLVLTNLETSDRREGDRREGPL